MEAWLVPSPSVDGIARKFAVVLQPNRAHLAVVTEAAPRISLVPNTWHCVCISHSQPYLKRSHAKVYLDGALVAQQDLVYPSARELDNCVIAPGMLGSYYCSGRACAHAVMCVSSSACRARLTPVAAVFVCAQLISRRSRFTGRRSRMS